MLFGTKSRLRSNIAALNRATGRSVSPDALAALAQTHRHPRRMLELLGRVLAFESDRWRARTPRVARAERRLSLACDYEASLLVSRALALFFEPCAFEGCPGYDRAFVAAHAPALERDGYALAPGHVPSAVVDRIRAFLADPALEFREDLSGKIHRGYRPECVAATTANVCRIVDQAALLASPDITGLACDPSFLAVAQRFLGTPPVLTQVNAWWSVSHSEAHLDASTAAQKFHQDRDYVKFVKFFIYLTDVGESNGPHQFITGSNADYAALGGRPHRASKRREDAELLERYGRERLRVFTAPRGSVLIEDTSGFHKGTPVKHGHRMLLQLEYVSTLFGAAELALTRAALECLDPALRACCPRLASGYRA